MNKKLMNPTEAASLIESGALLMIAGAESVLTKLPSGNWIGGTTPYFMTAEGCLKDTQNVFVTDFTDIVDGGRVSVYKKDDIERIVDDAPEHGFTLILLPAFSEIHSYFAESGPDFPGLFSKPILGWITGVGLEEIGVVQPKTFSGNDGLMHADAAVAFHFDLPADSAANIDIVNIFKPGDGPSISFSKTGFSAGDCKIDGKPANLAKYIEENKIDTRLPLVADYCGAIINTSIASVESEEGLTRFYAPVFDGVEYRFADALRDYATGFMAEVPKNVDMAFSCNCILNYVYGDLEGKSIAVSGPITFGEVAYQLLNQTMVYLQLDKAA